MDNRQLKSFIAAAEELNLHRAASRLQMSQPSLTRNLHLLEDELGALLFSRETWGVALTDAGKTLLKHAYSIENQLAFALAQAQQTVAGKTTTLDVGAFGAVLFPHVPLILDAFKKKHPEIKSTIHNLPKGQQIDALRQGRILVSFDRAILDLPDLQKEVVIQEPLVVVLNQRNPLAERKAIHFTELRNEPMIHGQFPVTTNKSLQALSQHYGFLPEITQSSTDILNAVILVACGLGFALLPRSVQALQLPGVAFRPLLAEVNVHADLYCLYRSASASPLLDDFLETVRDYGNAYRLSLL